MKNRKKYYVSIASREISQIKFGNNADFTIYASSDEVRMLRAKMDNMYESDFNTFWRSHVPIVPYHIDGSNDDYDQDITEAFQMIYDLGNDDTKKNIDSMGVLGDLHM